MQGKKSQEQTDDALKGPFDKIRGTLQSIEDKRFCDALIHNTGILSRSSSNSQKDTALDAIRALISKTENLDRLLLVKNALKVSGISQANYVIKMVDQRIKALDKSHISDMAGSKKTTPTVDEIFADLEQVIINHTENEIQELERDIQTLDAEIEKLDQKIQGAQQSAKPVTNKNSGLTQKIQAVLLPIKLIKLTIKLYKTENEIDKQIILTKVNQEISTSKDPKVIECANDILLKFKKNFPKFSDAISAVVKISADRCTVLYAAENSKTHDWVAKSVPHARQEVSTAVEEKNVSSTKHTKK